MAYSRLAVPLFEACRKQEQPLLILFVDMDRLKYINDTFGHDMGNLAIKTISGAVQECCPKESVAMRYGGDEFVVLVPGYGEEQARALMGQIQARIEDQKSRMNTGFPIEASIGYVITSQENTMNLNDYINLADEKMYAIKKAKKAQRI
jgi:diguanylate cyclase (GGDEF)-like protein